MIYLINDRAFIGPVVDMHAAMETWMESKIGPLEVWPGKPEGWNAPWPNFNNAQVESFHYRRSEWFKKTTALMYEFCDHLLTLGYTEEPFDEI